jgi:hypothetical protein
MQKCGLLKFRPFVIPNSSFDIPDLTWPCIGLLAYIVCRQGASKPVSQTDFNSTLPIIALPSIASCAAHFVGFIV